MRLAVVFILMLGAVSLTGQTLHHAFGIPATGESTVSSIHATPGGGHLIAGYFTQSIGLDPSGATPFLASAGGEDAFAAAYDATGALLWMRQFSGSGNVRVKDAAVDTQGNIVLVGRFAGSLDLGGVILDAAAPSAFVAVLDSAGITAWAEALPAQESAATRVAFAPGGEVYLCGTFDGALTVPGGSTVPGTAGQRGAFLARFGAAGLMQWLTPLVSGSPVSADGLAVNSAGLVVLAGVAEATFQHTDTDGFIRTSHAASDPYMMKLTASGVPLWTRVFGGAGDSRVFGLDVAPDGRIVLLSASIGHRNYADGAALPGDAAVASGEWGAALATYEPSGKFVALAVFDGFVNHGMILDGTLAVSAEGVFVSMRYDGLLNLRPNEPLRYAMSFVPVENVLVAYDHELKLKWAATTGLANALHATGGGLAIAGGLARDTDMDPGPGNHPVYQFGAGGSFVQVLDSVAPVAELLRIATQEVPEAYVGHAYNMLLECVGGNSSSYLWVITGGLMPPGVQGLGASGNSILIGGIPTQEGSYTVDVTVYDGASFRASREFTFVVQPSRAPRSYGTTGACTAGTTHLPGLALLTLAMLAAVTRTRRPAKRA